MSVIEFPGKELPPVEAPPEGDSGNTDKAFAEAFCDLEAEICDLDRMGEIAERLIMECSAKEDSFRKLELATFAVWQLAKRLGEFKHAYYAAYHGERRPEQVVENSDR